MSPAVVSISSITRQYDLVALTTVLLVWGLAKACAAPPERPGGARRLRPWLAVLWVAAATAAALLTHYQAVLLVAGGVLYSLAGVLLPRPGRPAAALVAAAARPGRRRARRGPARAGLVRRLRARALASSTASR